MTSILSENKRTLLSDQVVRSIHSKCRLLLEALTLIVSPLSVLYKTTLDVVKPKLTSTATPKLKPNEEMTLWLHLLRPTLYHSPRLYFECCQNAQTEIMFVPPKHHKMVF